ncbi:transposase [Salinibacter ruber]|uniref:transposase n=1 Tax=Salinibacter ruber TaxID=146919 RepID=UPI0021676BF9
MLDAILYVVKTETQWRMLPGEFAQWQTVYYYFRRWREEGRILCILSITSRSVRRRTGRHGEPSALIIDCQSVLLREWAESAASTLSEPVWRIR